MKCSTTHWRYHILHLDVFWMHHGHSAAAKGNAAGARANTSRTNVGSAFAGARRRPWALTMSYMSTMGEELSQECHRILMSFASCRCLTQATLVWWEKMGNGHGTWFIRILYTCSNKRAAHGVAPHSAPKQNTVWLRAAFVAILFIHQPAKGNLQPRWLCDGSGNAIRHTQLD